MAGMYSCELCCCLVGGGGLMISSFVVYRPCELWICDVLIWWSDVGVMNWWLIWVDDMSIVMSCDQVLGCFYGSAKWLSCGYSRAIAALSFFRDQQLRGLARYLRKTTEFGPAFFCGHKSSCRRNQWSELMRTFACEKNKKKGSPPWWTVLLSMDLSSLH